MSASILPLCLLAVASIFAAAITERAEAQPAPQTQTQETSMTEQRYVGMWVTDDGYIRHELLPNGRYDEQRGSRKSAYRGRYVITGDHIDYVDDTGFTADGEFVDGVLHHGGMVFRRQTRPH
jgi:hypothetical protein